MYSVIAFSFIASIALGSTATQTDWSEGPGTTGPVLSWDSSFYHDTDAFWYNSGSISLEPYETHVTDSCQSYCIFPVDIDSDGDIDIASVGGGVSWWENPGTDVYCSERDTWTQHLVAMYGNGRGVTSEDIDGDGDMDLIGAAAYGSQNLVWWENEDGTGTLWSQHIICTESMGACAVSSIDVDGDGDQDIICGAWYYNNLAWWENEAGDGNAWTLHVIDDNFHDLQSISIVDVNSDGLMDIVGCSSQGSSIVCWIKQDVSGLNWQKYPVGGISGAWTIDSQDIDGDGDMDVVGVGNYSDEVHWWENADGLGTVWTDHLALDLMSNTYGVHLMDADGDGDQDIITVTCSPVRVIWLENAFGGGTVWSQHIINLGVCGLPYISSADFDGDGDRDPVCGAFSTLFTPEILWWDLNKFQAIGELDSSVLETDIGTSTTWSEIYWSAEEPTGASISFLVRSSENPDLAQMGPWSDTLFAPCNLEGVLTNGESYVQYRAILETTDLDVTPVLQDVSISWNSSEIHELSSRIDSDFSFFAFTPNPTSNEACIRFETSGNVDIDINIYDLSGRIVFAPRSQEYSAGVQNVEVGVLPSGVYICRIRAGEFIAAKRFVIAE